MLDFNDATIDSGFTSKFLDPGIHTVTIDSVTHGESAQKKTPYIKFKVVSGEQACEQEYYTSTTVKDGSTKSAWDISKNQILQIFAAAIGTTDPEVAKTKMPKADTTEKLASALNTALVGKTFAIKLHGKEIIPSDPAKKNWIKSEFGSGKFAVPTANKSELVFIPEKHIKRSAPAVNGAVKSPITNGDW